MGIRETLSNKLTQDFNKLKNADMKTKIIALLEIVIIIVAIFVILMLVISFFSFAGFYTYKHINSYLNRNSTTSSMSGNTPNTNLTPSTNSTGRSRWNPAGNRNSNTLHYWGSTGQVIGTQQDRSDNYYMGGLDTTPYEAFSNIACNGNSCNGGKYGDQNDEYGGSDSYGMNIDLKSDKGLRSNLRRSAVRGGMRLGDDSVASLWRTSNGYEMNGISRNIGDFYRNQ